MKCRSMAVVESSLGVLCFLFVCWFCVFLSVSGEWAVVSERSVLLELKSSFEDPAGVLSSWSDSSVQHHCSWLGVSCDSSPRVVSLRIAGSHGGKPGNSEAFSCSESSLRFSVSGFGFGRRSWNREGDLSLRGGISPSIGKLSELRVLSLAYNGLSGEIPVEIWGLEKLKVVDLEGNSLTGKLPSSFSGLRKLRVLNLGFNRIDGEIPLSLSECGDLEVLNLAGNAVNGTIPGFLGSLSKLKGLYLSQNRLTGAVLEEFGSGCENLEHLDLSGNFLVGRIPCSLGKCQRLRTIKLFSNLLSGNIPRELGGLRMLEVLDVSRNSLGGRIPAELRQCANLSVIVLSKGNSLVELSPENDNNHFEGSIPEEITTLPNLRIVWAPKASLEGKLPSNWGDCQNLEMVNLAQNLFKGEMFGVFDGCMKLHHLDLSSNQLTGGLGEKLPVPCMSVFNVSGNLLSGPIPRFKSRMCSHLPLNSDLAKFDNPYKLFFTCQARLETNFPFSGTDSMVIHDLSGNGFSGPIRSLPAPPNRLGNQMTYAFLAGGNKLTGSFSESLFGKCDALNGMILNVSNNSFSGHIPLKIGVLCRSLLSLDVSGNEISGSIPQSLGDLTSLVILDLSRNKLHGKIPLGINRLKHLKYLSLADNNLTGSIPRSFGWFHSLEMLDLSSNSLSGDIPKGLVYSRNLTVLLLNNNNFHEQILSRLTNVRSPSTTKFSRILLNNNAMDCRTLQGKASHFTCGQTSLAVQTSDQQDLNWKSENYNAPQSASVVSTGNGGINSIEVASIASASAIVLVLLALIVLFFYTRKWMPDSRVQGLEPREINVFNNIGAPLTFESIVLATGNFNASNCIGNGGFGSTYKAEVHPGITVAVKRLAVGRFHGVQQFHAEVKTLGRVRHPNLVTLVGYHASETEMFLIYNYLPGGNLENFIKERSTRANDWKILHKIALDIAHALAYLHDQCVPRVLHRDVKPSNILLDNNLNAYLSDFGLSRLLGTSETHATTGVAGTFGYLAPEYAMTCRVSDKSDVYSYGVVLLELISDKKPLDPSFSSHGDGFNIVSWASMLLTQGHAKDVFTAGLWDSGPHDDLVEMLHLAITCTKETLSGRPTMKHVVQRLKRIQPLDFGRK